MTTTILTTERLILRSVDESDFEPLFNMTFSNPKVMRHVFEAKPLSREEAMSFFNKDFDHDVSGNKIGVLIDKETGQRVGFGGPISCSALGENDYEIGFVLGTDYWGKGLATEIGKAQIEHGLNTLGCKRLLALVAPKNTASIAVLKKIGMTHYESIETEHRGKREIFAAFQAT